jgi:DNA-binding GntR family transcriptional regulator
MARSEAAELRGLDQGALLLRRASTAEQAADVLRRLILRGEIEAGMPVRELHLAAALEISRNTMREALRILGREGLVIQGRHRVATVVEFGPDDVADVFRVRALLEHGAVAELRRSGRQPDLRPLAAAIERLTLVRDEDPWWEVIEADLAFHVAVVELAASPRLIGLYRQLEAGVRLCLAITTRLHVSVADIEEQHRTLLRDIEAGDDAAYVRDSRQYMDEALALATRVLTGDSAVPETPGRRRPERSG